MFIPILWAMKIWSPFYYFYYHVDYKDAQYRQYQGLIKQINPDLESYEKKKLEL